MKEFLNTTRLQTKRMISSRKVQERIKEDSANKDKDRSIDNLIST